MPYRRRGSFRMRPVLNSIKNVREEAVGITATNTRLIVAKAVNNPDNTVDSDVAQGCIIKSIWISLDICGLGGTGVLNSGGIFLIKNPGDNLTPPGVFSVGSSNEKKFVFKQWFAMIMRNQDGNVPYHWEGWVKVPKRYQRMGTDDRIDLVVACTTALTGHFACQLIYKWYT